MSAIVDLWSENLERLHDVQQKQGVTDNNSNIGGSGSSMRPFFNRVAFASQSAAYDVALTSNLKGEEGNVIPAGGQSSGWMHVSSSALNMLMDCFSA